MTDYVISAVKYKDSNLFAGQELFSAKVHAYNNSKKKPFNTTPYEWTRQQVIGAMRLGKRFNTYYKCLEDKVMKLGGKIEIVVINDQEFIRTKGNNEPCDNISQLPLF